MSTRFLLLMANDRCKWPVFAGIEGPGCLGLLRKKGRCAQDVLDTRTAESFLTPVHLNVTGQKVVHA
jgi:hypothetical protein